MENNRLEIILTEILKWHRFQGQEILRRKVKELNLLVEEKDILVYYHSDGEKSTRELGKLVGISHMTVQSLWKKWMDAGIVVQTKKYGGGRCRRLFSLEEMGVSLPKR